MFFTALNSCSLRLFKLRTEGQTIYRTSPQSYKAQIKILAYPGLAGMTKLIYHIDLAKPKSRAPDCKINYK